MSGRYYSMNRTLCDVLEELRKCNETRNYSIMLSLVEEADEYFISMVLGVIRNAEKDK